MQPGTPSHNSQSHALFDLGEGREGSGPGQAEQISHSTELLHESYGGSSGVLLLRLSGLKVN